MQTLQHCTKGLNRAQELEVWEVGYWHWYKHCFNLEGCDSILRYRKTKYVTKDEVWNSSQGLIQDLRAPSSNSLSH